MSKKSPKAVLNVSEAFESDLKKIFVLPTMGVPICLRGNKFIKAFKTFGINTKIKRKLAEKLYEDFRCELSSDKDPYLKPSGLFDLKLGNKSLLIVAEDEKKIYVTEFDGKRIKSYDLKNSGLAKVALTLQFSGIYPNLKLALSAAKKCNSSPDLESYISAYARSSNSSLEDIQVIARKKMQLSRQMKVLSPGMVRRGVKPLSRDLRSTLLRPGLSLIFEYRNAQNISKASQDASIVISDLIIDEYQIYQSRKAGAEIICLQASILDSGQLKHFLKIAGELNMPGIVHVKNRDDLKAALVAGADVISLSDLKLLKSIPRDKIIIYTGKADTKKLLKRIPGRVDAILSAPSRKLLNLLARPKTLPKSCGVRSIREVRLSRKMGVDCIGLNFIPDSEDRISYQQAVKIITEIRKDKNRSPKIFGVFQGQDLSEVKNAKKTLGLDFVQLSGEENLIYPGS